MKKSLLTIALIFACFSVFVQYKSVVFAGNIVEGIREIGRVLANGEKNDTITDYFFEQADDIRIHAQDSFVSQQISLGLLTGAIIFIVLALLLEKKDMVPK